MGLSNKYIHPTHWYEVKKWTVDTDEGKIECRMFKWYCYNRIKVECKQVSVKRYGKEYYVNADMKVFSYYKFLKPLKPYIADCDIIEPPIIEQDITTLFELHKYYQIGEHGYRSLLVIKLLIEEELTHVL